MVKLGGWFPQTWWSRVAVPAYDGPGSPAPALLAGDIQNTGIGGSPHPNDNGHTKLANTLNTAFNGL